MANVNNEQEEALNPESQPKKESLDLDRILVQEVGEYGWFQVRNIILSLIAVVFLGWSNYSYIFTTVRTPTRCHIPECDLEQPEFTPVWLLNAIPGTSLASFDNCHRYGNLSIGTFESNQSRVCPATWFDREQLRSCERHIYQNTDSVVYDLNLGCDEWRRSMIGSFRTFGTFFTQLFNGFISDRWGRRTALVFNAFNCAWLGTLKYFANNYIVFAFLEFAQCAFGGGSFQCAYILLMEMVGSKYRVLTGVFMNTGFSLGLITLSLAAWAMPYWRHLVLMLSLPQLLTISYIWLMSESARWYLSKNRYEDCEKTLKNIARVNKRHLSDKTVEVLRRISANNTKLESQGTKQNENEPPLYKLLFIYKPVLFRVLITPFLWITFTLLYQGLTINAVGISGNKYLNVMAVAVAQVPGFFVAHFLLDRIGRKATLSGAFWTCGACLTGYTLIPEDQYALSLAFYLLSTSCGGAILSGLYIYTTELYPTKYRHRLFSFSSMMGRFGSVLAPLTPALGAAIWVKLPFALFAGCACVAGALVLLLPETRGARLPDSMQEAADLGRKKGKRKEIDETS